MSPVLYPLVKRTRENFQGTLIVFEQSVVLLLSAILDFVEGLGE